MNTCEQSLSSIENSWRHTHCRTTTIIGGLEVDVERSKFKLASDKLPIHVSRKVFCDMSILLHDYLSIMDLISVRAAMRQFMALNSAAAHLMTRTWLVLFDCISEEKFETRVSVFRTLFSCDDSPWIHVTSFMVCSRVLGHARFFDIFINAS